MDKLYELLKKTPVAGKMIQKFFTPEAFGQFVRYLITGVVSFTLEYTLFIVLRNALTLRELTVNVIVYTVIFWVNFLLNKFFSFRSHTNFKRQLCLYGFLFIFNLVVGNVLLFSGIRRLLALACGEGSWPVLYLPKILIMFFIISWNFVLYKKVIYK